jgi:tetratricopeptide (TPR) repeat protein
MHAGLGYVQKRRGRADVALGHFKRAVEINPEHWSKRELPEAQKTKGETP